MVDATMLTEAFEGNRERYLQEWQELLCFPSVSADPARADDCRACAEWLVRHLAYMDFATCLLETESHPVVFGELIKDRSLPTVLLYGHYDVQPVDPLDLWDHAPFSPVLREGRIYARGAQDNKGQHFYALKAIEALRAADALPVNVKVLLEGDEETGSVGIEGALETWADRLAADILLVTDVGQVRAGVPTIVMGLRGIIHVTAELHGAVRDLHSGVHGGVAPNPAAALARLVSTLHADDGRIAVEHFTDGVATPDEEAVDLALHGGFDARAYEKETGVAPVGGRRDAPVPVRAGFEPTVEVNGLLSGYGGPGAKTIIPSFARVKLSARLVPGQDPARSLQALVTHLQHHAPAGLALRITEKGVGGTALELDHRSPLVNRAREVLRELDSGEPVLHWEGASIPIVTALAAVAGAEPLLIGFGHEEDCIHAPNESFSIEQFRQGFTFVALMLQELGL